LGGSKEAPAGFKFALNEAYIGTKPFNDADICTKTYLRHMLYCHVMTDYGGDYAKAQISQEILE
jgi:hypothetical protein